CGTTCPTCGGPWRAAVKVCRKCGKAVGRSERWRMVPAGPGLFAIEHREPCGMVEPWQRDDVVTRDVLDLADVSVPADVINTWTDAQCQAAEHWAALVHQRASDNPVRVPPVPKHVKPYREGER